MFQDGELDAGLAMQLLGGALSKDGGHDRSKKRPLDGNTGQDGCKAAKTDDHMSDDDGDADGPSVDDLLDQAKKVKNEPKLKSNGFWKVFWDIPVYLLNIKQWYRSFTPIFLCPVRFRPTWLMYMHWYNI